MKRIALFSMMVGLLLGTAEARTWTVEKDGSGDFTVIQDAVDVASDGDVIAIGPGRYDDYQTVESNNSLFDIYVFVQTDIELSFVGTSPTQTIIGPEDPTIHGNLIFGFACGYGVQISIENLSVENIRDGGVTVYGSLFLQNCRFSAPPSLNADGVSSGLIGGARIENCSFEGLKQGISAVNADGAEIVVEDCEFLNCRTGIYGYTSGARNVTVQRCTFTGQVPSSAGVAFLVQAGGTIADCTFMNCKISLTSSGPLTVTDCSIIRDDGRHAAIIGTVSPLVMERNIFQSNGTVMLIRIYSTHTIRDNHILRTGEGFWVESGGGLDTGLPADFSHNYWGTTDLEAIAAGIWDCQDDPQLLNCVTFEPVADAPVAVEPHSLTGVKELFR